MNTSDLKRIALIVGFVAVVMVAAFFLYWIFFKPIFQPAEGPNTNGGGRLPNTNGAVNIPTIGNVNGLPSVNGVGNVNGNANASVNAGGGETQAITPSLVSLSGGGSAVATSNGGLVTYDPRDGKFYRIGPNGERIAMSDQTFPEAKEVVWNDAGTKAIIEFPDSSNIFFDFSSNKQATLPKEGKDFAFDRSGENITFKFMALDPESRYLVTSKPDGTSSQLIEPIGDKEADVQVSPSPTGQVAALFRKSIDATRQEVFFVGYHGENFKSMITEGRDFRGSWSPQGDQLLYSVYTPSADFNPTLWIADASGDAIGQNRRDLGVSTWVDKCTFSSSGDTAYCAVPRSLPRGAGLVRELANNIPDDFYRINLTTGAKTQLGTITTSVTATRTFLSSDEHTLYFTDSAGRVYRIAL